MRQLSAALLVLAVAACAGGASTSPDVVAQTNQSESVRETGRAFDMKIGETVLVGGTTGLRLTFQRVANDSRCPIDAVCVWQGDAEIALRIQQGSEAAVAALHTDIEPRKVEWNGFTISLLSLAPATRASTPIDPKEYRAQLIVTR